MLLAWSNGLFDLRIIVCAPVLGRDRRLRANGCVSTPSSVCLSCFIIASIWVVLLPLVAWLISQESLSCYFTATPLLEALSDLAKARSGVSPPVFAARPPNCGTKPPCTTNDLFFCCWPNCGRSSPAFTLLFSATLLFLSSILLCSADFWSLSSVCITLTASSAFFFYVSMFTRSL